MTLVLCCCCFWQKWDHELTKNRNAAYFLSSQAQNEQNTLGKQKKLTVKGKYPFHFSFRDLLKAEVRKSICLRNMIFEMTTMFLLSCTEIQDKEGY